MEYSWQMEETGVDTNGRTTTRTVQGKTQGLFDDLEAFMAPVADGCGYPQHQDRRIGVHQLPESPPDSGSEHPYSPAEPQLPHPIAVSSSVLGSEYMLVHDQMQTHELIHQNGDYIYEELKPDNIDHDMLRDNLNDVVVLPSEPTLVELGMRGVRHDINMDPYPNRYNQIRVEMSDIEQGILGQQLVSIQDATAQVYTNLQEPSLKKRKHSHDMAIPVKCEPVTPSSVPQTAVRAPSVPIDGSEAGDETPLQCIRFGPFHHETCYTLFNINLKPIITPTYVVGADKGFNYSSIDESFVCQKKNHFQVTCQIQVQEEPHFVKTVDGYKKITNFCIHFYGVKAEDPSQEVRVEQSQSDRTKKPFHPVPVDLRQEGTKVTVGRLHFAETTNNNMRKKGRPNPDQRHFQLVVALKAHCQNSNYMVAAQASDRIIVRASNPGQFESDCSEGWWQRGVSENSLHFNGRVGINTDRPDESCVINGNLKVMGLLLQPSDARAKHNIEELDTAQQLKNVQNIRVVKFNYDQSFAQHSGLLGFDPRSPAPSLDTGVIAQEVRQVLPEAVKEAGDVTLPNGDTIHKFLVVNKDRIFMENLGAVKELCKVTGNLETRIDQLEKINKKLCKITVLQRRDSARSSISNDSRLSGLSNSSKSPYSDSNISMEQIRDIARNIRKHECCHKLSHNSPNTRHTRKQCKSCNYTKYGKNYNYYKTCAKYNKDDDKHSCYSPKYIDSLSSEQISKNNMADENYSTISKKKDSCLWMRNSESEDNFVCGKTNVFCCCKGRLFNVNEVISNKQLLIFIPILMFILAVCLAVISALYFYEHQELMSMKKMKMHDKLSQYSSNFEKLSKLVTPPSHRSTPAPENGYQNQIQNSKHSPHATAKKTSKEKGPHKTTAEYLTTSAMPSEYTVPHITTPSLKPLIHASKNYVQHVLNIEHPSPVAEYRVTQTRGADVVGNGCALDNALNIELDVDCQTVCNLDPPQAYDGNQEPIERSNPDKELNETNNFARAPEPPKDQITLIFPEKNNTENFKTENNPLKLQDVYGIAESNLLDPKKIVVPNGTENETTPGRLKRQTESKKKIMKNNGIDKERKVRTKRETNEALMRSSSEEMTLNEESDENAELPDCENITFGVKSKTFTNETIFEERICANTFYNFSYTIPLSKCLKEKHIDIIIRSSKIKDLRLCDLQCKYDTVKNCQLNREIAKPIATGTDDAWTSKMTLECNMDREMKIRAGYLIHKDLCYVPLEQKVPFVEFNIRLYRDCHN